MGDAHPTCYLLEIHQDQVARYGGASGIRDIDLLKSAPGMPSAAYGSRFLRTDIHEMAYNQILTKN